MLMNVKIFPTITSITLKIRMINNFQRPLGLHPKLLEVGPQIWNSSLKKYMSLATVM